jgi:hypothetical protein
LFLKANRSKYTFSKRHLVMTKQVQQFALFILVVSILTSLVYHVLNRNDISLQKAHRLAVSGRYSEAVPLYEKLVADGVQSKDVYEGLLAERSEKP